MENYLTFEYLEILLWKSDISFSDLCRKLGKPYIKEDGKVMYNMLRAFGKKVDTTQSMLNAVSEIRKENGLPTLKLLLVEVQNDGTLKELDTTPVK